MSTLSLGELREEYMRESLDEKSIARDPIAQFEAWFQEAITAKLPMLNAMTLATAAADGAPSARVVLLKGLDARGFVFYTDYQSRKARELTTNPRAALLFYWAELEREVRVEGRVERTSSAESDEYFASRPLGSRLAAVTSHQSSVIADRQTLERHYEEVKSLQGDAPARPALWGGYRVAPDVIEFWQGRANRLHDRLLYRKSAVGVWTITRLAP